MVTWPGRIGPQDEVTLGEAAELLGLSPGRVTSLVEAGEIPARTNYSVTRISLGDIEVYRRRRDSGLV
jgi:predicted HTH domain antitoxin